MDLAKLSMGNMKFLFLQLFLITFSSATFVKDVNSFYRLQEKATLYMEQKKSIAEGSSLPGSMRWAPDWIKHLQRKTLNEKDGHVGLYFPILQSSVMMEAHSHARVKLASGYRHLLEANTSASSDLGGNFLTTYGYYITLSVGSENKTFNLQVDTGSSLLWLPCDCEPNGCAAVTPYGKSVEPFNTSSTTTGSFVSCDSSLCQNATTYPYGTASDQGAYIGCNLLNQTGTSALLLNSSAEAILPSANEDDSCEYFVLYGDQSTTAGNLFVDSIWLQLPDGVSNFETIFGCARKQSGNTADGSSSFDGLVGLGRGGLSIMTQLATTSIGSSFSICMEGDGSGGHLILGRQTIPDSAFHAPLYSDPTLGDSFYVIQLADIQLNGSLFNVSNFPLSVVIDSGSTFTTVATDVYAELEKKILEELKNPPSFTFYYFGVTCVYATDLIELGISSLDVLPPLKLVTSSGDILTVPPSAYANLYYIGQNLSICLTFSAGTMTVLGDSWLQNLDIIYDSASDSLYWLPVNCTTGMSLTSSTKLIDFSELSAEAATLEVASPPPPVSPTPLSNSSSNLSPNPSPSASPPNGTPSPKVSPPLLYPPPLGGPTLAPPPPRSSNSFASYKVPKNALLILPVLSMWMILFHSLY